MHLILIAPDIQAEFLARGHTAGRKAITGRPLRRLHDSLVWEAQRTPWAGLGPHLKRTGHPGRSPAKQDLLR